MADFTIRARPRFFAQCALVICLAGCASEPTGGHTQMPAARVRLTVANRTSYAWQIRATPASGLSPQTVSVPPKGAVEMTLGGGDCALQQTMLNADGGAAATRCFVVRLTAGESYTWPLATLLSEGTEASDNSERP